jgi:hypothetical protein
MCGLNLTVQTESIISSFCVIIIREEYVIEIYIPFFSLNEWQILKCVYEIQII